MAGFRMRRCERAALDNVGCSPRNHVSPGYRIQAINHDGTTEFYNGNELKRVAEDSRTYLRDADLYIE